MRCRSLSFRSSFRFRSSSFGISSRSSSSSDTTGVCLSRVVLMIRGGREGLHRAVQFYQRIGLNPRHVTDDWAELVSSSSSSLNTHTTTVHLQAIHNSNEASVSTGYSPILVFQLPPPTLTHSRKPTPKTHNSSSSSSSSSTLHEIVAYCVQAGAHLDGPVQFPAFGAVAVLRSPDGHMMGLYEPAAAANHDHNDFHDDQDPQNHPNQNNQNPKPMNQVEATGTTTGTTTTTTTTASN